MNTPVYINNPSNTTGFGFYEYLPPGFTTGGTTKYPLVLAMHGSGQSGDGTTTLDRVTFNGPAVGIRAGKNIPGIVIQPQLASGSFMPETMNSFLDNVLAIYPNVDTSRIYITGLSLGSRGVWDLLMTHGDRFAAAVPVSAYFGNGSTAAHVTPPGQPLLGGVPIWEYHSFDDTNATTKLTNLAAGIDILLPGAAPFLGDYPHSGGFPTLPAATDMTAVYSYVTDSFTWYPAGTALSTAADQQVRFTIYRTGNHSGAYANAYVDQGMYDWMFSQQRTVPEPTSMALVGLAGILFLRRQR